ncbi:mRNA cleavage and polyadenylation factor CLP1 [Labeo rohita]|uniref:mRNA cleavage and polyadenylation factor CLP1 n=1 Tax=Labeo rohita TaxID=84645 RepID=A0ABQ8L5R3_LABRO|nr:mRNA cleavage and polyadenylation factor CLP1 [Labeo rohita]
MSSQCAYLLLILPKLKNNNDNNGKAPLSSTQITSEPIVLAKCVIYELFFMFVDVKALMCFQNKRPKFTVGSVGPYNIQVQSLNTLMEDSKVSDENQKDPFSRIAPVFIKILNGSKRAKSHYFLKNNILEGATEVFGAHLEGGNHWSFFLAAGLRCWAMKIGAYQGCVLGQKHCSVDKRCITYFNSLGETEWQCQAIAQHWW